MKLYYKNLVDAQYMAFHFGIETYVKKLGVDEYHIKKKYWGFFEPVEGDLVEFKPAWVGYGDCHLYGLITKKFNHSYRIFTEAEQGKSQVQGKKVYHNVMHYEFVKTLQRNGKSFIMPQQDKGGE